MNIENHGEGLLYNDGFRLQDVQHHGTPIFFQVRVYEHEEFVKIAQSTGIKDAKLHKALFFNRLDYKQEGARVPFLMGVFSRFHCETLFSANACLIDFGFRSFSHIYKGARIDPREHCDVMSKITIGTNKLLRSMFGYTDEAASDETQAPAQTNE